MMNMIRGMMAARWTRKNICLAFGVSREFAGLYLQPARSAEQVAEIIAARAAIAWEF